MGGGCQGWSTIVYMSSGIFRGKESSNRIELSRLVQELLNFGVSGSLWLWGGGGVGGCGWGLVRGCSPHMCTCMHTHAHTRTHIYTLNMIISIANGSPHWGNPWEFLMMSYMRVHACICMHVHMCGGHPLTTIHPYPPTPTPRGVDPQNQSKFNST